MSVWWQMVNTKAAANKSYSILGDQTTLLGSTEIAHWIVLVGWMSLIFSDPHYTYSDTCDETDALPWQCNSNMTGITTNVVMFILQGVWYNSCHTIICIKFNGTHTRTCTHTHACMHIHTHACTNTHTHTHTHTLGCHGNQNFKRCIDGLNLLSNLFLYLEKVV